MMSDSDLDELYDLAARGDRIRTHSNECWKWHKECAIIRLIREVRALRGEGEMVKEGGEG
jgi:hypothetical protein